MTLRYLILILALLALASVSATGAIGFIGGLAAGVFARRAGYLTTGRKHR